MTAIDVHAHLRAPGPRPDAEELASCRRLARAQGIERVQLVGNLISVGGLYPSPEDVRAVNDNTLAAVAAMPDLFQGLCYLNPEHGADFCLAEMRRCIVEGGMVGVKLWVAVNARDPRLDPIMAQAAAWDVPVLYHAWFKTVGRVAAESDPYDIAELARRHPRVRIVMAHLPACGVRGVRVVARCPNVWVDTSGGPALDGVVEDAVAVLGAERVLFGSDWPVRDFAVQLARVQAAALTPAQRRRILYVNAKEVFGSGGRGRRRLGL